MLAVFRKAAQHLVVRAILFLIVLSFVFWGVGDVLRGGGNASVVASVGSRKIPIQELDKVVRDQVNRTPGLSAAMIKPAILNQMINRELLLSYAEDNNMGLGMEAVTGQVRHHPSFLNNEGVFDYELFKNRLRAAGMNEAYFLEDMRENMIMELVLGTLSDTVTVPPVMLDTLYNLYNEERTIDIVTLSADHANNIPDPSEQELQEFYEKEKARFSAPEYRSGNYVVADCRAMAPITTFDENAVKEAYETRRAQGVYERPETRTVTQLFFPTKEAADAAYASVSSSESFDQFAKEHSNDTAEGAKVSTFDAITKDSLPDTLQAPVFALKQGEISKPVEGPLGWHIFKATSIAEDATRTFDDVKAELTEELAKQGTCKTVQEAFIAMEDEFAGGTSLTQAASKYPFLKVVTLQGISAEGLAQNGSATAELPDYRIEGDKAKTHFLSQFFRAGLGEDPTSYGPAEGVYVALQVTSSTPPRERALDEVKGLVLSAWNKEQTREQSQNLAKTAAKEVAEGKDIREIANGLGVSVVSKTIHRPSPYNRQMDNEGLPQALQSEVFRLELGKATGVHPSDDNNAFVFAVVKNIAHPQAKKEDPIVQMRRAQLEEAVKTMMFDEMMQSFTKALGDRYKVEINEKLLALVE
ncbi:MAG: hypothetical protein K0R63_932 [Rickettsiales bacterium]|jgi:peptidyl-prolyl cis-trans isomerase D|nr:hypothetical protein [Rickettsiales bacterium]